ncbi:hypothetical protein RchiOBHm_Chr7g0193921 [Rosa chinensis]|uniref:Uncharacterized protein n=1 Tax=Rosa chinensis TaxID=74649 RepID=A0A2P6P5Y2_ROSCH|nr:uncharacterized protein LOC112176777 [Rosa chinensis]PRQ17343.1 hypothetical protein RchiOBHm_Chr7g0193921 [Rosa chinensis]
MDMDDLESIGHNRNSSRCCFCIPSSSRWWDRVRNDDGWWSRGKRAIYKVREWSEIVAGPKWKTFIRRFNRSKSGGGSGGGRHGKFQYDPLSYALNFDEGPVAEEEDESGGFRDFSARFAPVKSSDPVQLGKDVAVHA